MLYCAYAMPELPEIASIIKRGRRRLGISQAELADRVGVGRLQVIKWEAGRIAPSDENRPKLAEILNVPHWQLERELPETDPLTLLVRGVVEREVERALRMRAIN